MPQPKLLVEPEDVLALAREGAVLLDARAPARYREGHLPGAVSVPVMAAFAVENGVRRLLPRERLAELFGRAGVDLDRPVVVYGERESVDAANLFWALECLGHPDVRVLDGGIERWLREGFSLTHEVPSFEPKGLKVPANSDPEREPRVSGEWLRERLGDPEVQVVDNRTPEEYAGEERYALRGGHIPGARLLPYDRAMNPDGTFKAPEEIRALYEQIGVDPERTVVNYCQTSTRSAHAYLAQRLAGFRDPKVYEGSWAEWGNDERFPVER